MQSNATTVEQYLRELSDDRRELISRVREFLRANLDSDYEEGMQYGMIGYYVPHRIFPAGYHCDPTQPLPFTALASQKNNAALYLNCDGGDPGWSERFRAAWLKTGRNLNMGKSCIRFKKLDDLAFDVLAETFKAMPAALYVQRYLASRA